MKDDLISRQEALNALSRGSGCGTSCHRAIKALPSAQLAQDLPNGCTDTISRAAVGDALNRIEISRNASWYEFYQKALTAVGTLPSAQPGWIPTSVRLPEEKTAVLITTTKGCVIQCMYWGYQNGHHTWRSLGNQYLYWEMDVVAWMPLPKPWEGGQDGKN